MTGSCPRNDSCVDLCPEERIFYFLERPANLVNSFVQFPCYNTGFFTMLNAHLTQILTSRDLRIVVLEYRVVDTQRRVYSISCTEVSFSAFRQYRSLKCFFVGGHPCS